MISAQVLPGGRDLFPDPIEQRIVHQFPCILSLLIEVEHIEQVGATTGQFLVADRVDVQLVTGDVLGLCTFRRLEINDRRFARVQPCDQIDPAINCDAGCNVNLDLLFGVEGVFQAGPVVVDISADGANGSPAQVVPERGVGEGRVQVPVNQVFGLQPGDDVAGQECALCTSAVTSWTDLP